MKAALSASAADRNAVERVLSGTLKITGGDRLRALWVLSYAAGVMVWEAGTENGPGGHVTLHDAMERAKEATVATVRASLDKLVAKYATVCDDATVQQACHQPNKEGR